MFYATHPLVEGDGLFYYVHRGDIMIKREYIVAKRIVTEENVVNSKTVLKDAPRQVMVVTSPGDVDCITVKKGGYIVLDFGRELQGGIVVSVLGASLGDAGGAKGMPIRLTFGESVMEALSTIGYKNAVNDHSIRDFAVCTTVLSTQHYGNTGFRFVRLEALECDINFSCIQAFNEMEDLPYLGEFECDDERLNEIWRVGAYTMNLNMQEYIWDGVKRDRLVWAGDINPEIHTIASVFGGADIVNKSLDLLRDMTPSDKWMNTIVSYTMWWIINHRDWYMYTGDIDYLRQQKDYLIKVAENIINLLDENNEYDPSIHSYIDWSAKDKPQEWAGRRAVTLMSLQAAADIAAALGEDNLAKKYITAKNKIADYKLEGYEEIKQITAICSLAGLVDLNHGADIIEKDGCRGFATFMGYYAIQVLAKTGRMEKALDIIRQYWGGMLDMGATTFWEDFDIEWTNNASPITEIVSEGKKDIHGDFGKYCYTQFRHSLCHGWASGPTAFMSQYVLGIFPAEPGFKKVKIQPQLGNLHRARGKFPTPYGVISVDHRIVDNRVVTEIDLPSEIEIVEN